MAEIGVNSMPKKHKELTYHPIPDNAIFEVIWHIRKGVYLIFDDRFDTPFEAECFIQRNYPYTKLKQWEIKQIK